MQYLAVLLLIAGVAASVVSTGVGEQVTAGVGNAICRVAAEDCKTAAAPHEAAPKPNNGQGSSTKNIWNRPYQKASPTGGPQKGINGSIFEVGIYNGEREWLLSQGFRVVTREGGGSAFDMTSKIFYLDTTTGSDDQKSVWTKAFETVGGIAQLEEPAAKDYSSREKYVKAIREYNTENDYQKGRLNRMLRSFYPGITREENTVKVYTGRYLAARQDVYDQGYEKAVTEAEKAQVVSRPLSEAEKQWIGERGGRAALDEYYKGQENYYVETWNRAHPPSWKCLRLWYCS